VHTHRLAKAAGEGKHICNIINEKSGEPAEESGDENGDVHQFHYSPKKGQSLSA
jgi:hypothetical protein